MRAEGLKVELVVMSDDLISIPVKCDLNKHPKGQDSDASRLMNMWSLEKSCALRGGMQAPCLFPITCPMYLFYLPISELFPCIANW